MQLIEVKLSEYAELIWLNEFGTIEEARESIRNWIMNDYNKFYVHSSLGYLSPKEFELKYYTERERNVARPLQIETLKSVHKNGVST